MQPDDGEAGSPVELPVEVKWSHNPDGVAQLVDQLGTRYVLAGGRTHVIYAVGSTGEAPHRELVELAAALEERRKAFGAEHRETRVSVFVLRFMEP